VNFDPDQLVRAALAEDMPRGDITTDGLLLGNKMGRAKLVAKEDLVLSGQDLFSRTFQTVDSAQEIHWHFKDGDLIYSGQTICTVRGPLASLLKSERVALNFLGRLSGIATLTHCFASEVKHTKTKILDTRKTTPTLRALEKKAVLHGGGENHRFSLSDAVLIKENHIRASGGISAAIALLRKKHKGPIEVEVCNLAEVREAVESKADRILLDNMSNADLAEALKEIPSEIKTEASGNMSLERVRQVADLGVDYISVGAITHSAPSADISLLFE
jgi:nicotinate-nucleotide pyrophosphorylase (carboxylating)